jgi:hypothetical protein
MRHDGRTDTPPAPVPDSEPSSDSTAPPPPRVRSRGPLQAPLNHPSSLPWQQPKPKGTKFHKEAGTRRCTLGLHKIGPWLAHQHSGAHDRTTAPPPQSLVGAVGGHPSVPAPHFTPEMASPRGRTAQHGPRSSRGPWPVFDQLDDFRWLASTLTSRPTRWGEVVDFHPVYHGAVDASGVGMGSVWLHAEEIQEPLLWRV